MIEESEFVNTPGTIELRTPASKRTISDVENLITQARIAGCDGDSIITVSSTGHTYSLMAVELKPGAMLPMLSVQQPITKSGITVPYWLLGKFFWLLVFLAVFFAGAILF